MYTYIINERKYMYRNTCISAKNLKYKTYSSNVTTLVVVALWPRTPGPGPRVQDPKAQARGPGTQGLVPNALGHGTWASSLGPGAQGPRPRALGPGPGAKDPGPRVPGQVPGARFHVIFTDET